MMRAEEAMKKNKICEQWDPFGGRKGATEALHPKHGRCKIDKTDCPYGADNSGCEKYHQYKAKEDRQDGLVVESEGVRPLPGWRFARFS